MKTTFPANLTPLLTHFEVVSTALAQYSTAAKEAKLSSISKKRNQSEALRVYTLSQNCKDRVLLDLCLVKVAVVRVFASL